MKISTLSFPFQYYGYDDGGCSTESQCFMCSFKKYPKATFRGMCKNDMADWYYTLIFDEESNLPYFKVFASMQLSVFFALTGAQEMAICVCLSLQ